MKKEMLADKWGLILTTVVRKSPLIALITTNEMINVAMLPAIWIWRCFIHIYGPTRPTKYKQSQVAPTTGLYAEMDKLFMKLCRSGNPLLGTVVNRALRMQ
jgi:hypothetical protein